MENEENEVMTFAELLLEHKSNSEVKNIDSDLLDIFERKYGVDEIEELTDYEVFNSLDYDGSLHEHIDGKIDIYYNELRVWFVDNAEYVNEAIDQGLTDGESEIHSQIQSGQYVKYLQDVNEEISYMVETLNELVEKELE